jgi:hypothetical protein
MMRRIGWFCDLEALAEDLDVLPRLVERAGLTTLVPESHLTHTSRFGIAPEVAARGPLERWRERPGLAAHREAFHLPAEAHAALPGIVAGADDRPLRAIMDAARGLGLEVWGHIGLWCYGGEVFPELAMRDAEGSIASGDDYHLGVGFCPSRLELNDWIGACLADATRRYGVDGWFVDHARYPSPGNIPSLWGCACASCAAAAERLGHDFAELLAGLRRARAAFGRLDAPRLAAWLRSGVTALDLWQMDGAAELRAWFQCRADLLTAAMTRFRAAAHAAAGRAIPFGADVFPPSIALLGGHDYATWEGAVDYMTGGFGGNVGWGLAPAKTIQAFARAVAEWVPGLAERDALALVATLFGYERFGLAERIEEYGARGTLPQDALLEHELRKAAACRTGRVPFYPPMNGRSAPVTLVRQCEMLTELGFDGAIFAALDRAENEGLAAVRGLVRK